MAWHCQKKKKKTYKAWILLNLWEWEVSFASPKHPHPPLIIERVHQHSHMHPVLTSCPISPYVFYGLCPHRSRSISGASSGLSTSPLSSPRVSKPRPQHACFCLSTNQHASAQSPSWQPSHTPLHCTYYMTVISDIVLISIKNEVGLFSWLLDYTYTTDDISKRSALDTNSLDVCRWI